MSTDNSQYAPATVTGGKGSHAPVLSVGHVTILIICIFENMCCCFFQSKKIPENECILSIIYNFESLEIQAWIMTHHDHLVDLTFIEFFTEFKNKFLPANWKDDLIATQITMQSSQAFLTWTESVKEANTELTIAGSDYHIVEGKLRAHFVPRLLAALKASYNANNTHGTLDVIADLEAWIQWVHLLDLENQSKREEWLKIAQSTAHMNAKISGAQGMTGVGGNTSTSNAAVSGNTPAVLANTMNAQSQQPLTLKLTQVEHDLLRAHRGCFCCRIFYAGHYAPDCTLGTNERPTPKACKNVNLVAVLKAKAVFKAKRVTMVAAIFKEEMGSNDFEMTGDKADEYMPDLSLPSHLWWNCCIDAPLTCAPTPI